MAKGYCGHHRGLAESNFMFAIFFDAIAFSFTTPSDSWFKSLTLRTMGVPLPKAMNNQSLTVVDNRTGKSYTIPISNNSIPATAFKKIAAPFEQGERLENETDVGLRVFDPG